ncbi:MAG TPA: ABC transporter permease [Terriglobales bacterium]|nr:ABC transporter permease [Terriglobales bacterium]
MLKFWQNPEFVRHLRSELRRTRALSVLAVIIVLCILAGLGCWAQRDNFMSNVRASARDTGHPTPAQLELMEQRNPVEFWQLYYRTLMTGQLGILSFWVLFACAQSVSGERERKTWDFQRTTRLSPTELLIGKLLGEPILAYFIVLCCIPISVFAGLRGEIGFLHVVYAYTLVFSSALFVGLLGIWLSSMFESRSRGVGVIGALGLYALISIATSFSDTMFPGIAALSPFTGLDNLLGYSKMGPLAPTLFSLEIPWVAMSLLLYISFGSWFVVMILRNLKRDPDELRMLSRWQVVGCVAFLNFLAYGLLNPTHTSDVSMTDLATLMVGLNTLILALMGLATLTPHERLKIWWRRNHSRHAGIFAEDGLPWPWLAVSAVIAYGLMIWGLSAWKEYLGYNPKAFQSASIQLLGILIFITRDVLFIQWCTLTRMRAPVLKGILCLGLYYATTAVITLVLNVSTYETSIRFANLVTPAGIFNRFDGFHFPATVFVGMGLQLAAVMFLLIVINRRLARPAVIQAVVG